MEPLGDVATDVDALRREVDTGSPAAVLQAAQARLAHAAGLDRVALIGVTAFAHTARGELVEAVRQHALAFEAAQALRHGRLQAEAAIGIGNAMQAADDHAAALQHYERAGQLVEVLGDARLRVHLLRRIGVSLSILGRHRQAASELAQAQALADRIDFPVNDRLNLTNSMLAARNREIQGQADDDAARQQARIDLLPQWLALADAARRAGNERSELIALGNHAIVARECGRVGDAIAVFESLIPRYEALGMRPNVAVVCSQLGRAFEEARRWPEARQAFAQAIERLEADGSRRELRDAQEGQARVCEAQGDAWGALAALKAVRAAERAMSDDEARRMAARRELQAELARQTDRWLKLANEDPLTGLGNRRVFDQWQAERADDRRAGRLHALLLLDLDRFKAINDGYGHAVGDTVLVQVARVLREGCPAQALPMRLGGEEFVVALRDASAAAALELAEQLRVLIEAALWAQHAPGLAVTVSIGAALSDEAPDGSALMALADRRLYQAKRAGRNRVCGPTRFDAG